MKTRSVTDSVVQCIPALLLMSLAVWPLGPALAVADAAGALPEGWREVRFSGQTHYRQVEGCWRGTSDNAASGLVLESRVNVSQTPWLVWSWRASTLPAWPSISERSKDGDDFLARVYVIHKGWLPWQTRAINYVWSREARVGEHWPTPFADQAHMVVVQGRTGAGEWQHFARDVRADFLRYHGIEVERVDAVAIMTDTDNTASRAEACYRLPVFQVRR